MLYGLNFPAHLYSLKYRPGRETIYNIFELLTGRRTCKGPLLSNIITLPLRAYTDGRSTASVQWVMKGRELPHKGEDI